MNTHNLIRNIYRISLLLSVFLFNTVRLKVEDHIENDLINYLFLAFFTLFSFEFLIWFIKAIIKKYFLKFNKQIPNLSGDWLAEIESSTERKVVKVTITQTWDGISLTGRNFLLDNNNQEIKMSSTWNSEGCTISPDGRTISYSYRKLVNASGNSVDGYSKVRVVGDFNAPSALEGNYADLGTNNAGTVKYKRVEN